MAPDEKTPTLTWKKLMATASLLSSRSMPTDKPPYKSTFSRELWLFLRVRRKFWLLPILIMMTVFGGLVVLTKGSAVAPFIYTIF
jgi:hypothetical protein